jgi:hypothetical protein
MVKVPRLLPWERLLWSGRPLTGRAARYALTDFRLIQCDDRRADEILIQDIGEIQRTESTLERVLGLSTLAVHARHDERPPFVLRRIRRGAQLAALLELLSDDPSVRLDAAGVHAALSWDPRAERGGFREAFFVLVSAFAILFAVGIGLHGKARNIAYPSDDAIYPNGEKRDTRDIVLFMEKTVMPWARDVLGPLKGGPGQVTCQTCHGRFPEARGWQMPGVARLPQPDMAVRGWETYSSGMDAQTRNAIYGYVAEADNQTTAAYMRRVVMPGMARLLHRPAYDFTKPYDYNRTRLAFGCYHCHQVR